MKAALLIACVSLLGGCATAPRPAPAPVVVGPDATSALAFDPPVTMNVEPLDLSRDTRGPAAFVGFEDSSTTYFDTYTDDRRTTDNSDRLDRETYSEKVGDLRR